MATLIALCVRCTLVYLYVRLRNWQEMKLRCHQIRRPIYLSFLPHRDPSWNTSSTRLQQPRYYSFPLLFFGFSFDLFFLHIGFLEERDITCTRAVAKNIVGIWGERRKPGRI